MEEITGYVPKKLETGEAEWKGIFERLFEFLDDGHAIKLARAVANGEAVTTGNEAEEWVKIRGVQWLKIGNMVVDSVEDTGKTWARSVGFKEAVRIFPCPIFPISDTFVSVRHVCSCQMCLATHKLCFLIYFPS